MCGIAVVMYNYADDRIPLAALGATRVGRAADAAEMDVRGRRRGRGRGDAASIEHRLGRLDDEEALFDAADHDVAAWEVGIVAPGGIEPCRIICRIDVKGGQFGQRPSRGDRVEVENSKAPPDSWPGRCSCRGHTDCDQSPGYLRGNRTARLPAHQGQTHSHMRVSVSCPRLVSSSSSSSRKCV